MEHKFIGIDNDIKRINLEKNQTDLLKRFSHLIHENSSRFNLTGLKTIDDIADVLIAGSLDPFAGMDVPRGTFYDMGTGAGIPGIPFGIFNMNMKGYLIESNKKKSGFLRFVIGELGLDNLEILNNRAEIIGLDPIHRESADLALSRAIGNIYISIELGAPLLKQGGVLYIYSEKNHDDIHSDVLKHAENLALSPCSPDDLNIKGGITLRKNGITDSRYPRKFPVINRESKKVKLWK